MNGNSDERDGDERVGAEGDGNGDGDGHGHGDITPLRAAAERVRDLREEWLDRWPVESVSLDRIAGRTLAEPVDAPDDVPARSHATMDGYAFDATEGYPYDLVDQEVFPESDPPALGDGEAVRIFTGAPLPAEANAVLKQEEATVEDGRLDGSPTESGTYVYERGSNVADGERLFVGTFPERIYVLEDAQAHVEGAAEGIHVLGTTEALENVVIRDLTLTEWDSAISAKNVRTASA